MNHSIIFNDDYSDLPEADIIKAELRDQAFGKWEQTSHHYSWRSERVPDYQTSALPWRVAIDDGKRWLEQPETWENVVICAGDEDWGDYELNLEISPMSKARCGVLLRYQTSRHNYYFAFENEDSVVFYKRYDDDLTLLDSLPFNYKAGEVYSLKVTAYGEIIEIEVNGSKLISISDRTFTKGKIGLRSDGPVRYGAVSVSMPAEIQRSLNILREKRERHMADIKNDFPKAEKVASVPMNVEADYLHIDDYNNDGEQEVVFIKQCCLGLDMTEIAYIGMTDLKGNVLWSHGEPKENLFPVHSDVAYNFGDIDGDGEKEIIVTQNRMIKVYSTLTGELKNECPTPSTESGENIIGDSILLADLEGNGEKRNLIVKDRYKNIWAYDNKLNLLWHRALNTGHYPRAADINGDGRDEIMAGYSMLSADGETMWTVPGANWERNVYPGSEHADSIWIGRFGDEKDAPVKVAMAASDLGFLMLDANSGELLCRERCGHAQSLAIGKFRKELPGYQFAVSNLWGNTGIFTMFDCEGNRLACTEKPPFEPVIPVNWRGDGEACFVGGATRRVFDKNLNVIFQFPKANSKQKIYVRPVANDFLNLGLDQLAFFDDNKIGIFKSEKHGDIKMIHEIDNFNMYGAFVLRY